MPWVRKRPQVQRQRKARAHRLATRFLFKFKRYRNFSAATRMIKSEIADIKQLIKTLRGKDGIINLPDRGLKLYKRHRELNEFLRTVGI